MQKQRDQRPCFRYMGLHYFLIFALKHRLWVLVRTASVSRIRTSVVMAAYTGILIMGKVEIDMTFSVYLIFYTNVY